MLQTPIIPNDLDGPLPVMAVVRSADDARDIGPQRSRLESYVRREYDWPIEFKFVVSSQFGSVDFTELIELLDGGDWDVLILEDVSRLSRRCDELMDLVNMCAERNIRVIATNDGFDTADNSHRGF